jgi:hypothetical protein
VIGVLFQLLVVGVIKPLELLLDGSPLPPANSAAAGMLLLFLHLLQDGVLLDLDQRLALGFAQPQPEFLDPLTLLLRVCVPDLFPRHGRAVVLRGRRRRDGPG